MSANKNFSTNLSIPALKSFSVNYNTNNNTTSTTLLGNDPKFPPPPSPSQLSIQPKTTPLHNDSVRYLKSPSKKLLQMTNNLNHINLVNLNHIEPYMNNCSNNDEFKAEMANLEGIMKDLTEIQRNKQYNI